MAVEIERKFLVDAEKFRAEKDFDSIEKICQGYLSKKIDQTVRIRIKNDRGFLTIKSKTVGISRFEFEYQIPLRDAEELLKICEPFPIFKTRYVKKFGKDRWEIDVFDRENSGLILAEIELRDESEEFFKPAWLLEEVSTDPRYFNSYLSENPISTWKI